MGIFSKIHGLIFGSGTSASAIAKKEEVVVKEPRKKIEEIQFAIDGVEYKLLCILTEDEETLVWGGKKDRKIEYDLLDPSVKFDLEHLYRTSRIACIFSCNNNQDNNKVVSWSSFIPLKSNEMVEGGPLHRIISLSKKDAEMVLNAIFLKPLA